MARVRSISQLSQLRCDVGSFQLGLTVYSPDTVRSGLIGHLDHFIHAKTEFLPVGRGWVRHDVNSIRRFYDGAAATLVSDYEAAEQRNPSIPLAALRPGHMVVRLLLGGPALATLWRGPQPCEVLTSVKGSLHPATAAPGTLRASFWCDNPVCNLMHSSDDGDAVRRELGTLGLSRLLDRSALSPLSLVEPQPHRQSSVRHSAVAVVCELIGRLQATRDGPYEPSPVLPESGDARATMRTLTDWLLHVRPGLDRANGSLVDDYLAGNVVAVGNALEWLPVTPWERFVLLCGVLSREAWKTPTC